MSPREDLLTALEQPSTTTFLELTTKHYSKADPFSLQEIVEELNKDGSKTLWQSGESLCKKHLLDRNLLGSEDEDCQQEGVAVLRGFAALLNSVLGTNDQDKATHAMPVVELVHGLLPLVPNIGHDVQNSLAKIFEKWWQNELPRRDFIVPHTVPYLIIRTLVQGSVVSDIQRLWSFRQAILILDFEDSSSDHLKSLLLQCLIHPLYIQTDEGRRLLSFLFGLHPTFTELVHSTIKQNIPNCPRPFLESYGEVYFRAWRASAGVYLKKIEEDCIQDLMHHAVHAQRTGPNNLAAALLRVLGFLHQQKVFRGMDGMLLRLYDPILWRALKVANVEVRANAAALLIDAFPLQNPDSTREQNDELLQKQINVLLDLLADPAPLIRTMGVTGICRVLGIYWELIPSAVLQTLLKRLIKDMACDVSSSAVRAAVFQGLSFVVENPLSHPAMAKVLPELKLHIHDTSERVRLAFIQLLLTIRSVRTIKFWDIVPMEHLLHRLAIDRPSIARQLVKLLYVSYQPVSKDGEVQLARCVELIQTNRTAARKFYQFVHLHMSTSQAGKFILFLCRTLRGTVEGGEVSSATMEADAKETPAKSKGGRKGKKQAAPTAAAAPSKGKKRGRKGRGGKDGQPDEVDSDVDDDSVIASSSSPDHEGSDDFIISGNNEGLISGLLECMVIVWQSIVLKLKKPGCKTLTARLEKEFSAALPEFFNSFKSSVSRAAILLLSSNVSKEAAAGLSDGCLEMFRAMPSTTQHLEYAPVVDACCSWGYTGQILTVLHSWLKKGLTPDAVLTEATSTPPPSRKAGSRKKRAACASTSTPIPVIGQEPVAQACFALDVLTWMLVQPSCRPAVVAADKELEQIITLLKSVLDVVEEHVMGSSTARNEPAERMRLLRSAFCMYTRLQVHLHAQVSKKQASSDGGDRSQCSGSPLLPGKRGEAAARGAGNSDDESLLSTFQLLLDWANDVLLTGLADNDEPSSPAVAVVPRGKRKAGQSLPKPSSSSSDSGGLKPETVATSILQELLATCAEITVLGLADRWFLVALAQACSNLVDTGKAGAFMPHLCKLLFQLTEMFHDPVAIDDVSAKSDDPVPFLLAKILQWLQEECAKDEQLTKDQFFPMFQSTVTEVVRTYHRRRNPMLEESVAAIMATITMAVVGMVTGMAEEEYGRDICRSLSDLPALCGLLLTVVSRSATALRSFLDQLQKSLDVDAVDTVPALVAVVHITSCLRDCGRNEQLLLLVQSLQPQVAAQANTSSIDNELQTMLSKATDALKELTESLNEP